MADGEYEVESIARAKLVNRPKKAWSYFVKWKGYGIEDNTWEPASSFEGGSEHFIDFFWSRVNTNGRDYKNVRDFQVNEEFFPSGPPRRKKATKEVERQEPTPASPIEVPDSETEVRSIIGDDIEASTPAKSKRRRSSVGDDAEPPAQKRKRKGPPGISASEMERREKALNAKRSAPDLRGESSRARARATTDAEDSAPSSSKRSSPRKRGQQSKAARRSSTSSDELLHSKAEKKTSLKGSKKDGLSAENAMEIDNDGPEDPPSPFGPPSLFGDPPAPDIPSGVRIGPPMPAHRVRAANPRVKISDDPNLTESNGAIAVKAKFMKRSTADGDASSEATGSRPRKASSKPGPGRSSAGLIVGGSRLTVEKGKLTTVKPRKARMYENDVPQDEDVQQIAQDIPALSESDTGLQPPPTGEELLKAAGVTAASVDDLPDFEEDAAGETDHEYIAEQEAQSSGQENREASVVAVEPPPAPAVVLEARPLTFTSRVTSVWNQSTIFGPLALGFNTTHVPKNSSDSSSAVKRSIFCLNLDPAVSIPVTLKDVQASRDFLDGLNSSARNPIGKFYKDRYAIDLVNTLAPQNSYARIVPSEPSNEEHKKHFDRFVSRLEAGELFIQMNVAETLVMCSSENSILGQKLNFPAQLLGLADTVIVAHVSIENHCEYADAALHADNSRW